MAGKTLWTIREEGALIDANNHRVFVRVADSYPVLSQRSDEECDAKLDEILERENHGGYKIILWRPREDQKLVDMRANRNMGFGAIAEHLPGRSAVACENRYYRHTGEKRTVLDTRDSDPTKAVPHTAEPSQYGHERSTPATGHSSQTSELGYVSTAPYNDIDAKATDTSRHGDRIAFPQLGSLPGRSQEQPNPAELFPAPYLQPRTRGTYEGEPWDFKEVDDAAIASLKRATRDVPEK